MRWGMPWVGLCRRLSNLSLGNDLKSTMALSKAHSLSKPKCDDIALWAQCAPLWACSLTNPIRRVKSSSLLWTWYTYHYVPILAVVYKACTKKQLSRTKNSRSFRYKCTGDDNNGTQNCTRSNHLVHVLLFLVHIWCCTGNIGTYRLFFCYTYHFCSVHVIVY